MSQSPSVRAKFKVTAITITEGSREIGKNLETGARVYEPCKLYSITANPVYPNGDPTHENSKFWNASPGGQLQLNVVNEPAALAFELGAEYYLDFTKAE